MSDKSRTICFSSILAILVASLPCAYFLLFQEYVRLAVLGLLIFALLLYYKGEFAKAYWRRALLGLSVVYAIYACDPLTAGSFDPAKETAVFYYVYAVLICLALLIDFLMMITNFFVKRQQAKNFLKSISITEWCVYLVLLNGFMFLAITEAFGMLRSGSGLFYSALTCFKPLAAVILFFLITRFCAPSDHEEHEKASAGAKSSLKLHYNLLAIFFIGFVFYSVVFGGAKIGIAVSKTRFVTRDANRLKAKGQDAYGAVMRAFSLCDDEAAKIYDLGYLAGKKEYEAQAALAGDDFKRRQVEKEALIGALIGQTQDFLAAFYADSLDPSYRFATHTVTQHIQRLMKSAQQNSYLLYFLSRLNAMAGNQVIARNYLQTFGFNYPDHPSVAFLTSTFSSSADKVYTLPCAYWLVPREDAAVERTSEEIVMLNGRSTAGYLWLPPGKYSFTLYARDEGADHEKAKEMNFDPACKAEIWVGDESSALRVISEDRKFQPYEMEFNVKNSPELFTLRFTNDRDEGKGLDRNLGLQKLEIRCVQ
ncbi:hypothetical protein IKW72_02475 [bacterium]|nr:hypothetical protein [bacterium]